MNIVFPHVIFKLTSFVFSSMIILKANTHFRRFNVYNKDVPSSDKMLLVKLESHLPMFMSVMLTPYQPVMWQSKIYHNYWDTVLRRHRTNCPDLSWVSCTLNSKKSNKNYNPSSDHSLIQFLWHIMLKNEGMSLVYIN